MEVLHLRCPWLRFRAMSQNPWLVLVESLEMNFPGDVAFRTHTAISAAVVLADATTIFLAAPAMSFKLTMGMSPF